MSVFGVSLRVQSECGKMRTRITPNTDTSYAVRIFDFFKITLDFLSRFNFINKLNKVSVFYVFQGWNNLKRTHHLSENCHRCFELSGC